MIRNNQIGYDTIRYDRPGILNVCGRDGATDIRLTESAGCYSVDESIVVWTENADCARTQRAPTTNLLHRSSTILSP